MKESDHTQQGRILYMDFLRVISIFFVFLLHAAATQKPQVKPYTYQWLVINTTISIARWSVPVFLMISGYFFLNPKKKITISQIFSKYIKRIVIAYLFWSLIYAIATTYSEIRAFNPRAIWMIIEKTFRGHAHYWYLLMIIGLYIITPILKVLIQYAKENTIRYFLVLGFIFSSFIPLLKNLTYCGIVNDLLAGLEVYLVIGYTFYYVLGYYLGNYELSRKTRIVCYLLGLIGALITSFGYFISTNILNSSSDLFQDYLVFSNVFMSVAIFVGVKQWLQYRTLGNRLEWIVHTIAKYSFGMYLTNDIFNMLFYICGITIFQFGVIKGILLFTVIDFIGSYLLISILHKLPILRNVC